jgi:2-haloacid dehalogenase
MLDALVHASGIAGRLSDVISTHRVKTYNPDPECYDLVAPTLGVANREVLFASSNSFDVAGAESFGFRVAWIKRGRVAAAPEARPAEFFRLLRGRGSGSDIRPIFGSGR